MFTQWHDVGLRSMDLAEITGGDPETLQKEWELRSLVALVQKADPRNILEIGSYRGGTLLSMMRAVSPGANFLAIDFLFQQKAADIWCKSFGCECLVINGNSHHNEAQGLASQVMPSVDFLFIDGGHLYGEVKADFEFYGKLVKPGGIIAFHDILRGDTCPELEVWKLWGDIQEAGYVTQELVVNRKSAPGGIGVVYIDNSLAGG